MIEGPFISQNLTCDGHFPHLISLASPSSSTSSATHSSSSLSPSSSSFSSIDDSPPDVGHKLSIGSGSYLSANQNADYRHSAFPHGINAVPKLLPTPPYLPRNAESGVLGSARAWPRGGDREVAIRHAAKLRSQVLSTQPLPKEQLQNPRRSNRLLESHDSERAEVPGCPLPPPALVRQSDRKVNFVDNLVDTAAQIVEAIWPPTIVHKDTETTPGRVLPLRTFIQETLRRSRTSYSTLQVALYYLFVIKPFIPLDDHAAAPSDQAYDIRALQCGRRMFLAALILASKYLQDKNYSARAWSKISGLGISEINTNELSFLSAVNWRLHISDCIFDKWTKIVLKCTPAVSIVPSQQMVPDKLTRNKWVHILSRLDSSLDYTVLDEILDEECQQLYSYKSRHGCDAGAINKTPKVGFQADASISPTYDREVPQRTTSLAFALARPLSMEPLELMPARQTQALEERGSYRSARKSSLSICESMDMNLGDTKGQVDEAITKSSWQSKPGIRVSYTTEANSLSPNFAGLGENASEPCNTYTPLLDHSRSGPRSKTFTVLPAHDAKHVLAGNRKRGFEHAAATRHQKKQKDKISDVEPSRNQRIVPSGLTPQMRQMNTNFSITGKKGNGLRLTVNPRPIIHSGLNPSQNSNPGQRAVGKVVYG